jgi:hypothetical protein
MFPYGPVRRVTASAILAAVVIAGCVKTIPYQQPTGTLWGFTEDSLVRSDIGRSLVVTRTKDECERNKESTRKQPGAEYAKHSECREMIFGSGDAYWTFTFPSHITLAIAWGAVNRETCERSRRALGTQAGLALSPCTLTSVHFK